MNWEQETPLLASLALRATIVRHQHLVPNASLALTAQKDRLMTALEISIQIVPTSKMQIQVTSRLLAFLIKSNANRELTSPPLVKDLAMHAILVAIATT